MTSPQLDQGPDYERGFVDGMQHQMQSNVHKAVNRLSQVSSLTVGDYTLTNYPGGDYWLQHKDGEGMQVRKERMETLIKELWKEF